MKSRILGVLALLTLVFALTACNGSGGSDSSSGSGSSSASGAVSSVPLVGAEVWSYNAEGVAVQIGKTLGNGSIKFDSAALSEVKFPNAVVFSKGGHSYINNSAADFAGTLKGVMASPTSSVYLTPANTLVAALVEEGVALEEAKNRVKKAVNVEMGVNIDPFANPLEHLTESEIVAQTIFAVLGIRENAAGDLDECMDVIADKMNNEGNSFALAVKNNIDSSPLKSSEYATKSMFEAVKDLTETMIMPQVKAVLSSEDGSDTYFDSSVIEEQEKEIKEAVEQEVPLAIVAKNVIPKLYTVEGVDLSEDFTFVVASNKFESVDKPNNFGAESDENTIELRSFEGPGKVESKAANVFTYSLDADAPIDLPCDVTVVLQSKADPTVTKTIQITLVSEDSLEVFELEFTGEKLYPFTNSEAGKIVDGDSHTILADEFIATIEMQNVFSDVTDNVDVRFIAPTNFKFEHLVDSKLENTDDYLVTEIIKDTEDLEGYDHIAKISSGAAKLVAVLDEGKSIEPGFKDVGMQVLDEKTGAVLETITAKLLFLPEGMEKHITDAVLGSNSEIYDNGDTGLVRKVTALNEDGNFAPTKLILKGSIKTWEKAAKTDATAPSQSDIRAKGKVLLVSTSGANVFVSESGATSELDITDEFFTEGNAVEIKDGFHFTADVASKFVYKYSEANDDIMLKYVPNSETDGETIISSSVLKLQFDDIDIR